MAMPALNAVLLSCVLQAASVQQLPPELLISVIKVEGGAPGVVAKNSNKTEDLGVMQVNTGAWLPLVARAHFAGDRISAYQRLRDDGCYNIQVGAWILRRAIDQEKGDLWQGVGRYHSATPMYKQRYSALVQRAWNKLFPSDS
jgi:soluble lytic murein transglycosylase-like protein